MTMILISTVTVGSGGTSSIDFTSIPTDGRYTDLFVVMSLMGNRSDPNSQFYIKFNNSSSTYTNRILYGNGSSTGSVSDQSWHFLATGTTSTSNTFGNASLYVPNYAGSTAKSYSIDAVNENNATYANQLITAGLWSGTSAITSLQIMPDTSNTTAINQYSTASLYGILKGSGGATVS